MESQILAFGALGLSLKLLIPFIIAALVGAVIAGFVRVSTQINDNAISFAVKLTAVSIVIYFLSGSTSSKIVQYTLRLWGEADMYF